MLTSRCNLKGNLGIEELEHGGKHTSLGTKLLYDHGRGKNLR